VKLLTKAGFEVVVDAAEHPYEAALQPDILVGIVERALAVEATEETGAVGSRRAVFPEWYDALNKLVAVEIGQFASAWLIHEITSPL